MSEVLTPAELVQGPAVSTGDVREGVRAGLDLRDPVVYGQVRRIFLARWARVAAAEGCDVDDLLQEVYRSILARNAGTHPFRPRQGDEGRSNYIFMVCRSVTSNAIEKARRCGGRELLGRERDVAEGADERVGPNVVSVGER